MPGLPKSPSVPGYPDFPGINFQQQYHKFKQSGPGVAAMQVVTIPPFQITQKKVWGGTVGGEGSYKWTIGSRTSWCQHSASLDNGRNKHLCILLCCWSSFASLSWPPQWPSFQEDEGHFSLLWNYTPLLSQEASEIYVRSSAMDTGSFLLSL